MNKEQNQQDVSILKIQDEHSRIYFCVSWWTDYGTENEKLNSKNFNTLKEAENFSNYLFIKNKLATI